MQVSKSTLISAFSNGKFPTGDDFQNLIDSCYTDNSVVSSISAVSASADTTITHLLSANNTLTTTLTADIGNVNRLKFHVLDLGDGNVGIDASLIVSLQPSGSAIMYFEKGVLVELTVL